MRFYIEMTLEEFQKLSQRDNWKNLKKNEVFVDTNETGVWAAYEITSLKEAYDGIIPELREFTLRIV